MWEPTQATLDTGLVRPLWWKGYRPRVRPLCGSPKVPSDLKTNESHGIQFSQAELALAAGTFLGDLNRIYLMILTNPFFFSSIYCPVPVPTCFPLALPSANRVGKLKQFRCQPLQPLHPGLHQLGST